ncbi:hypothetical protein GCM10027176_57170 [Actinoallomurus bryophytorum]
MASSLQPDSAGPRSGSSGEARKDADGGGEDGLPATAPNDCGGRNASRSRSKAEGDGRRFMAHDVNEPSHRATWADRSVDNPPTGIDTSALKGTTNATTAKPGSRRHRTPPPRKQLMEERATPAPAPVPAPVPVASNTPCKVVTGPPPTMLHPH